MERPTEATYSSDLKEWINQIIKEEGLLSLSEATVEPIKDRKRTDILIYDHEHNPILLIEVKRPNVMHSDPDVVTQALGYVESYRARGLKNYVLHNVNLLSLWSLDGNKIDEFPITYIATLEEYQRKTDEIKEKIRRFLKWYVRFLKGERPKPIDESIVEILNQYILGIASATKIVTELCETYVSDNTFREHFTEWLLDNGFPEPENEIKLENYCTILAKQYLYLFTNKILFYNVLKEKYPLPNFDLPSGRLTIDSFYASQQTLFNLAIRGAGNYETVFQTNFVDRLPIPEDTINELRNMTKYLKTLDYSKLGYDIIGKVFEKLIPEQERHTLGQYFTRSDIVDLILGFCVKDPASIILDPACGSGTFLVRAYYRLKYLNGKKSHAELLNQLWGVDIAKFPAHLSIINLASRDLSVKENYPNIIYGDFFDLSQPKISVRIGVHTTLDYWLDQKTRNQVNIPTLSGKVIEKILPPMSAVVGNPPYTRQEEMLESVFGEDYKKKLLNRMHSDFTELNLSKRASIYPYFFVHGLRFFGEDGKRLGFVSLRSWLDVGYGKELKELFLDHCKIVSIIESREERWFQEAQMLPCISILELCGDKEERENNWVKFVQLKAPLSDIVPVISDPRDMVQEIHRWKTVDKFRERIENIENIEDFDEVEFLGKTVRIFEDEIIRVVMLKQESLRDDVKWGKYLVAPSVFFKILEKGKNFFVPFETQAITSFGIKTGANEFFYLPNKFFDVKKGKTRTILIDKGTGKNKFKIENEYLKPIVAKIKPHRTIAFRKHDRYLLVVNESKSSLRKNGKDVLHYIEYGETAIPSRGKKYPKRPTCSSRKIWYSLGNVTSAPIICPSIFWARHLFFWNEIDALVSNALFEVRLKKKNNVKVLCALLNSTFTALIMELSGRYIENRDKTISNQIMVYEVNGMPMINLERLDEKTRIRLEKVMDNLLNEEIGFKAMFTDEDIKRKDELDTIVFQEILGLNKKEMDDAIKGLAEMVRNRIERIV